jgi:flagellar assembly factor FliW
MSSFLTIDSSRFGTLEIEASRVVEFPVGLIGLGGRRWAIVGDEGPFQWLHSVDDGSLALPVTNPWRFFGDYEVSLSDDDTVRVGGEGDHAVWVTVRAGGELSDFSANLRAPIVIANGRGHQVINQSPDAPVRAPLFPAAPAEATAAA